MSQFAFMVTNAEGQKFTGTMVAADIEAAMKSLVEKDLVVTRIKPVSTKKPIQHVMDFLGLPQRPPMSGESLIAFTQQLSAMLEAGVTVKQALDVMLNDTTDPDARQMLLEMSTMVGAGNSVTEVLSLYPEVFSRQYIATVGAGENAGNLPRSLAIMGTLLEKADSLRRKVMAAMYYPAFIMVMATLFLILMLVAIVPRYAAFYTTMGGQLPTATRILVGTGTFAQNNLALLVILFAAAALGVSKVLRTPRGRWHLDSLKLKLPVFGHLFRLLAIARISRTLSCLLSSGVPLVRAINLVAETMGNVVLEKALAKVPSQIMEGNSIVDAIRGSKIFTEMSLSMVAIGEQSGKLDQLLDRVANYYEERVECTFRALAGIVEPLIILFVGMIVGGMVVALVLPVFQLVTLFMK